MPAPRSCPVLLRPTPAPRICPVPQLPPVPEGVPRGDGQDASLLAPVPGEVLCGDGPLSTPVGHFAEGVALPPSPVVDDLTILCSLVPGPVMLWCLLSPPESQPQSVHLPEVQPLSACFTEAQPTEVQPVENLSAQPPEHRSKPAVPQSFSVLVLRVVLQKPGSSPLDLRRSCPSLSGLRAGLLTLLSAQPLGRSPELTQLSARPPGRPPHLCCLDFYSWVWVLWTKC